MKPYDVRPATLADVQWLAPRLRGDDVREIRAASGQTPLEALTGAYHASSTCYAIEFHGELAALFGAAPTPDPTLGSVWLLGSDAVERNAIRFLRESRQWIDRLHESYPILFNYVDARNTLHLKWLKWIGCVFLDRIDGHGHEGRPFYEFVHIRSQERV